ncbi:TetR/AcrR family transcriptional regulator [Micromonospora sp. BQ11]|uniref:TetR/AcrR family transcriptional regulator n=1 Tax=Micromonospora sp. BQ11 TaxID=3452212 RepID=UPI003F8ABC4D
MSSSATEPARRADAQQNIEKILEAAITCLSRSSGASVSQIAQAAGVGRVTLYGHFPSREALVEAALVRLLARGEQVLAGIDLTGDPRPALRALIESGWMLMAQASAVLEAAQAILPPGRVHELHAEPERRVHALIRRGQAERVFRTDLPASWLAGVLYHLMKGSAADVAAGRVDPADAPRLIAETILAAYAPPPPGRPGPTGPG